MSSVPKRRRSTPTTSSSSLPSPPDHRPPTRRNCLPLHSPVHHRRRRNRLPPHSLSFFTLSYIRVFQSYCTTKFMLGSNISGINKRILVDDDKHSLIVSTEKKPTPFSDHIHRQVRQPSFLLRSRSALCVGECRARFEARKNGCAVERYGGLW
ncbi:hypothetical protein Hanom_Chr16g01475241 [Helianthus anomalus]